MSQVSERIQEALSLFIGRNLDDKRLLHVVIVDVQLSADLRNAKVYFRLLVGGNQSAHRCATLKALIHASSLLRYEIAKQLKLRYAPDFRFYYDESGDRQSRLETLFNEIANETKESEQEKANHADESCDKDF
ncbi:30S ribosome-binding factor RbfA [Pajaroellobacter abortibovis]|uniref:30S ribosome-binding factor RbfA n=1 Tax=Pajaroellobacter abortibovis TaxID=1882918 RepID=UPI0015617F93|nr:30S ribosome-binding factor RbfA [Pajaroellobacter abortibovis]